MGSASIDVVPLWINGKSTTSTTPSTFSVHSLAQEKDVFKAQSADAGAAILAAEAAQNAFATWKDTSAVIRRKLLLRVASEYGRKSQDLIESQMLETSCTETWAKMNVEYAIKLLEELACHITSISGEMPLMENPKHLALVFKEPVGVMLTIAPWNAAVILATRAIAGQIAAGCTVVFKASELCPRTHHIIREAWHDSSLPDGVLNVIQTRREDAAATTEALIGHPAIKKIEFIGSKAVGNIIGQLAAKYTKPIILEHGGKSPAIVLDDANLEQAAQLCVMGLSLHHGQVCFSTERIYVQQTVANTFMELLKSKQDCHPPGLPVNKRGLEQANSLVEAATKSGARVLIGGLGPDSKGQALKPTILTGVESDMAIWDQETFGPSASLYTFSTDEEAIKLANNSEYGLNAAIHSTNMERAINMARQLEVGQVHINNLTEYDEATLPIGGTKASGWGRNNARWTFHEYINLKTITVNMKEVHTYI